MPIDTTTVYTKESLLKLHNVIVASKKSLWTIMILTTLIVILSSVFLILKNAFSYSSSFFLILIIIWDLLFLFVYFVLPHFTVKKSTALNMEINYSFDTDCFKVHAKNSYVDETSTIQYSRITKVYKKVNNLYLFNSRNSAYIVDTENLSDEQIALLKNTFMSKFDPKKTSGKIDIILLIK